jgi:phosphopantetheinyl transferase (holo-ACP synthase)
MTEPSVAGLDEPWWSSGEGAVLARRDGYWLARADWGSDDARDRLAAQYLDDAELADLRTLAAPARDGRVLGRLAGKAAVCDRLRSGAGAGPPLAPAAVRIRNDRSGRPRVEVAGREPALVSLAHRGAVAVAVATVVPGDAGVDVEVVERRGTVFARLALTAAERRLGERVEADPEVWVTRAWTIKEAVAKAAGTGLRGRPKDFVVDEADGTWARAAGHWVRSAREGEMVVSLVAPRPA